MEFGHIYYLHLFKPNIAHIIGESKTMSTKSPPRTHDVWTFMRLGADVDGKSPLRTHDVWTNSHIGQEDVFF